MQLMAPLLIALHVRGTARRLVTQLRPPLLLPLQLLAAKIFKATSGARVAVQDEQLGLLEEKFKKISER